VTRGLPPADSDGFALEAVFAEATPLAVVPADPESNVDNYEHGKSFVMFRQRFRSTLA